MNPPEPGLRFSVIVASRGRPASLARTLRAIRQLDYPSFEVVVVGDSEALEAARFAGSGWTRSVACDVPNLSLARNLGIGASGGEVCAFIDDDAVPEPLWLRHHDEALRSTGADASVGFVRGPDGIRFQSRFETIDATSLTRAEMWSGEEPEVPLTEDGRAVKLIGTNMAVRRDVFGQVGGFDEAYPYYLEDADFALRLSRARRATAVAPLAEVHHALAASGRRTATRAPRTLFDIGRSTAVFLRRHRPENTVGIRDRLWMTERRRVERLMVRGVIEPRDVGRLMGTLSEGWTAGLEAELPEVPLYPERRARFQAVVPLPPGHRIFAAGLAGRTMALREAEAAFPHRSSVFSFSLTNLPRMIRYSDRGVWMHTGGRLSAYCTTGGRSGWCRFASRLNEEIGRVAKRRGIVEVEAASLYMHVDRKFWVNSVQVQKRDDVKHEATSH